jgi:fermentation-respiration switch protein FrsA (DUF1100 family)
MNVNIQFTSLKDVRKKKKSKARTIANLIIIVLILFNMTMLYIGNLFYNKAFLMDTKKELDLYESNKKYFSETRFNTLQREEVSVSSKNNYKLFGTYIKNGKATEDTVILLHGIGGSRWTMLKYVDMYLDKGFNVLIYDGRAHGESGGNNITYGYYEQTDLDKWVSYIHGKNKGGIVGVHGESMGASTALLHSRLNENKKRVDFYIVDSAYSDLDELLTIRMLEDYNLKVGILAKTVLFYSNIINKLKNNFSFIDASPKYELDKVTTPIFFIHGSDDKYVPKYMSEEMYNLKPGMKELYIAPNSTHVQAYISNPELYIEKTYNFLETIILKKDN